MKLSCSSRMCETNFSAAKLIIVLHQEFGIKILPSIFSMDMITNDYITCIENLTNEMVSNIDVFGS